MLPPSKYPSFVRSCMQEDPLIIRHIRTTPQERTPISPSPAGASIITRLFSRISCVFYVYLEIFSWFSTPTQPRSHDTPQTSPPLSIAFGFTSRVLILVQRSSGGMLCFAATPPLIAPTSSGQVRGSRGLPGGSPANPIGQPQARLEGGRCASRSQPTRRQPTSCRAHEGSASKTKSRPLNADSPTSRAEVGQVTASLLDAPVADLHLYLAFARIH